MKKFLKQLLPAFACTVAVGCSTTYNSEEEITPQFSEEQLEFQRMIAAQEASQIAAFRERQINNASLKITAALDSITNIEAELEKTIAEKTAKKSELLLVAEKLIAVQKKKAAESKLQDDYWKFVEEGERLEDNQPESKSMLNPINWFVSDDSEVSDEDAEFIAEEYEVALKINAMNQVKTQKAYENLQIMLKESENQINEQCEKDLAAIDKEIVAAREAAAKNIAKAELQVEANEEIVEFYRNAIEDAAMEEPVVEEAVVEEPVAEEESSFFGNLFSSDDEEEVVEETVEEEPAEVEESSSFFGNLFSSDDEEEVVVETVEEDPAEVEESSSFFGNLFSSDDDEEVEEEATE